MRSLGVAIVQVRSQAHDNSKDIMASMEVRKFCFGPCEEIVLFGLTS